MSRLVIRPYDPGWPGEFDALAGQLGAALGPAARRIDHIGSTAVPGLAAKDVIDIQVGVGDLDDPRIAAGFASLGATPTGRTYDHVPSGSEPGAAWEKRFFRAPPDWRRTHLHVRVVGRANHRYALLFRDFLRSSPAAVDSYAQVKQALAVQHPDDPAAYYAVKDPVCDLVMHAAERWAAETGWSGEP